MRRSTIICFGVAAAAVTAAARRGPVGAGQRHDDALDAVRSATRQYRKVERAVDAGYVQFFGCVHEPLAGSMGIHFVNGALAGDAAIDASDAGGPDVRGQAPTATSSSSASSTWSSRTRGTPPTGAARAVRSDVQLVDSPNRYGIPPFYELHAWAWKDQPDRRPPGLQPGGAVPRHRGPHALTDRTGMA